MPDSKRQRRTASVSPAKKRRTDKSPPAPDDCITQLKRSIAECHAPVTDLSDPQVHGLYPFPSTFNTSRLFSDARSNNIYLFGRLALKDLYGTVKAHMLDQARPANQTLLYGPAGVGKSRLLAALALILLREGICAIYIPDCSEMKTDCIARYIIKDALRVALPDTHRKRIEELETERDITVFIEAVREHCVLIADRWDALLPDSMSYRVLSVLCYMYPTFYAARPVKPHYPDSSIGDSKHEVFRVGGLRADELSAWFERNKISRISAKDRHDIEYLTGSVPRLLNALTDSKGPSVYYDIITKSKIAKETRTKINASLDARITKHGPTLLRYYLDACIKEETLTGIHGGCDSDVYDHDYTYFDKAGVGHCSAGIAWEAIVDKTRGEVGSLIPSEEWTRVINKYTNGSPTARGCMIEKAVLAAISESGIGSVDSQLNAVPIVKTFSGAPPFHLLEKKGDFFLMVPECSNYDAIDAILVKRTDSDKGRAQRAKKVKKATNAEANVIRLFPVQVTIARRHSDSVSDFFTAWGAQYTEALLKAFPLHSIKLTFVWVDKGAQLATRSRMPLTVPSTFSGKHPRVDTRYDIVHVPISRLLPDLDVSFL